ncbi:MAG: hypothetical protein KDD15_00285, partial [Lewinella sp.]|nr:hypothetical protein [Lewinella sp.]
MLKQLFNLIDRVTYFGIEHDDTYLERFRKRVLNRAFVIIGGGSLLIVVNAIITESKIHVVQPLAVGLIAFASLALTYFHYIKLARFILSVFLPTMFLYEIIQYGGDLKLDYTISFFIVLVLTMYDRGWPLVLNMLYLIFLQGFSYYYTANFPSKYADYVDPYDSITIMAFTTIGLFVLIYKFIIATEDFQKQQEATNQELREKTRELQQSNEFLENYTYIASHDLKSPLRSITSFSDLILKKLKDKEDENIKDYLKFLKTEVIQMNAVVEGIIENAKDNHSNLKYENVDT